MLNKEPLLDLLRTNTVSRYLARRSQNTFISKLRELLNSLGFGNELQWGRLGPSDYFGNETTAGVRAFCARNRIPFDGMNVTAAILSKMIQRQDALEGLTLLQRSQKAQSLQAAFNLSDPLNYGAQQLSILLENLDIYEPHIGT
ncbi:MAG: peptidoglycan-binding domain-containing protein, partial [Haliscomenobacter sp.]